MPVIYLASASPRRSQLLDQIGVAHQVVPVDLDESRLIGESPPAYVLRLAQAKAEALWERLPVVLADPQMSGRLAVLGSDTTVALGEEIFGKPGDRDEGIAMLARLSGRSHRVYTGVALRTATGCETALSTSEVTFGTLSAAQRTAYWATGEPLGKAGGYAVQGRAAAFITRIEGSYSGIMGLPLAETAELLLQAGLFEG